MARCLAPACWVKNVLASSPLTFKGHAHGSARRGEGQVKQPLAAYSLAASSSLARRLEAYSSALASSFFVFQGREFIRVWISFVTPMTSVSVDRMCHGDFKQSSSSGNRNIDHATCYLHREVERGTAGMVLHYHVGFLTVSPSGKRRQWQHTRPAEWCRSSFVHKEERQSEHDDLERSEIEHWTPAKCL